MNQEHLSSSLVFDGPPHESSANHQTVIESQTEQPPQLSQRKKQTRKRRILTTRIIPEDLLDMDGTRREIVKAIKIHRTNMKQNGYNHQQPQHQTYSGSSLQATPQPQATPQAQAQLKSETGRDSKIYDSNTTAPNFSNNIDTLSYQSFNNQPHQTSHSFNNQPHQTSHSWSLCAPNFINLDTLSYQSFNNQPLETSHSWPLCAPNFNNNLDIISYQSLHNQPRETSHSWPLFASAPPLIPETLNLLLPNQTLGLKLNLQEFDDLDITPFENYYIPAQCYSSTSPSPSNSPLFSLAREETPYVGLSQAHEVEEDLGLHRVVDEGLSQAHEVEGDLCLHRVVDDEEMTDIRSVGEQHQSLWDDSMNMVTSTWWSNFLDTMENDTNRVDMDFPPWLNANDNGLQQLDENYSRDCSQDQTLWQMDIGEIEGMEIERMMENGWDVKA